MEPPVVNSTAGQTVCNQQCAKEVLRIVAECKANGTKYTDSDFDVKNKTNSVLFDNSKVMAVAGAFTCQMSMEDGIRLAAERTLQRLETFASDPDKHALLDRIAAEQMALGGSAAGE